MKIFSLLLICLLSASCLTKVSSSKPVDAEKLTNTVFKGKSAIKGQVLTIEGHNKFITKERSEVILVPVCDASTDIINQIYPNPEASTRPVKDHPRINWGKLKGFIRVTFTDDDGKFLIANLSAGDYYLLSYINLRDHLSHKGGTIMRKIKIEQDKLKEVSLRL